METRETYSKIWKQGKRVVMDGKHEETGNMQNKLETEETSGNGWKQGKHVAKFQYI